MRGRKSALIVILTDEEFKQLKTWSRSTTTAVGLVRRADEVHTRKWLKRFLQHRLAGLQDLARPGRPPAFPPGGRAARG